MDSDSIDLSGTQGPSIPGSSQVIPPLRDLILESKILRSRTRFGVFVLMSSDKTKCKMVLEVEGGCRNYWKLERKDWSQRRPDLWPGKESLSLER